MTNRLENFPPDELFISDLEPYTGRSSSPSIMDGEEEALNRVDLRELIGFPPIRDQLPCNSCTAHGLTAIAEFELLRRGAFQALSAAWVHRCIGGQDCPNTMDLTPMAGGLVGWYIPSELTVSQSTDWCGIQTGYSYPRISMTRFDIGYKQALNFGFPIVTPLWIDEKFYAHAGADSYRIEGVDLRHHVVVLVGYDDFAGDGGEWLCMNSFGDQWGEGGFFRVPYGECGLGGAARSYCAFSDDHGLPVWPNSPSEHLIS